MAFASLTEPLRRVALFQGLQPLQISEIARRADRVVFKPGETIISEGQAGDGAYLIVSGTAVRTAGPGADASAEPLGSGTLIGEMAMLVETDYTSTVICREPIRALKIARASLLEQMTSDLALADHIVEKLAGRLKELANELRKVDQTLAAAGGFSPGAVAVWKPLALEAPAHGVQ